MFRKCNTQRNNIFLYKLGVNVPQDVTHILVKQSIGFLPPMVFCGCYNLKEVVPPEELLAYMPSVVVL